MQLIKLSATDSTNSYLRRISEREDVPDFTVVQAYHQSHGRGQRGNQWAGEPGKNLTFSLLSRKMELPAGQQFLLNILVSLSVFEVLQSIGIPGLRIKWPNDILSGGRKIGGILIENQLHGNRISQSIIGVGLNVNQSDFPELPMASSLKLITGSAHDLDELLLRMLDALRKNLQRTTADTGPDLFDKYEESLFMKDRPATYSLKDGTRFRGTIRGVGPDGRLKMELEGGGLESYDFQEISYLYTPD